VNASKFLFALCQALLDSSYNYTSEQREFPGILNFQFISAALLTIGVFWNVMPWRRMIFTYFSTMYYWQKKKTTQRSFETIRKYSGEYSIMYRMKLKYVFVDGLRLYFRRGPDILCLHPVRSAHIITFRAVETVKPSKHKAHQNIY